MNQTTKIKSLRKAGLTATIQTRYIQNKKQEFTTFLYKLYGAGKWGQESSCNND
jgi:hypothetical protein